MPDAALMSAEQSVGGLPMTLPGSRCKSAGDTAALFFTCQPPPALAPGAGDFTLFGASLLYPRSPRAVHSLG